MEKERESEIERETRKRPENKLSQQDRNMISNRKY
jgi:hypothetical protein